MGRLGQIRLAVVVEVVEEGECLVLSVSGAKSIAHYNRLTTSQYGASLFGLMRLGSGDWPCISTMSIKSIQINHPVFYHVCQINTNTLKGMIQSQMHCNVSISSHRKRQNHAGNGRGDYLVSK